jgi:hypothetical protein
MMKKLESLLNSENIFIHERLMITFNYEYLNNLKFKMFKHAYHGGPAVEVFTTAGKNPLEKWKVTGGGHQKVFDSSVKGYIYNLEG